MHYQRTFLNQEHDPEVVAAIDLLHRIVLRSPTNTSLRL